MNTKRRRKRADLEVVKTERDDRRADRYNDDTLDLSDNEVAIALEKFVTAPISRYRRARTRRASRDANAQRPFRFLDLPPELRDKIYRYLLVSNAPSSIGLDAGSVVFQPGGIETAILLANWMVYNEAVAVLYGQNKFTVLFCMSLSYDPGVSYRVDDPRTAFATSRHLRNGRSIDMVTHKGLIYKDIFSRLRKVEFHVDIFDRTRMCDYATIMAIHISRGILETLVDTIRECSSSDMGALRLPNTNWHLVLHSTGIIGYGTLLNTIQPLLNSVIIEKVRQGLLKVYLEGMFPRNWESICNELMGPHFSAEDVYVFDDAGLDPAGLNIQFGHYGDEGIEEDENDDEDGDVDGY